MTSLPRIRTPWVQRWHRFRQQILPAVSFIACAALTVWLWDRQSQMGHIVGEVVIDRSHVHTLVAGRIIEQPVQLFERVEKGDVIAKLGDAVLQAQLKTLSVENDQFVEEIAAAQEQLRADNVGLTQQHGQEARRIALQYSSSVLNVLDLQSRINTDSATIAGLDTRITALEGTGTAVTVIADLEVQRDIAKARMLGLEDELKSARDQESLLKKQNDAFPNETPDLANVDLIVEPLIEKLAVQQARIAEIRVQLESLVIQAPMSGTIAAVLTRPGQSVQAGDELVTIAAEEGTYLVSYIRREHRGRVAEGTPVSVRRRRPGSALITAEVEHVGPQVEPVPTSQLSDPAIPEWGTPVKINVPDQLVVRPGELVDVVLPLAFQQD